MLAPELELGLGEELEFVCSCPKSISAPAFRTTPWRVVCVELVPKGSINVTVRVQFGFSVYVPVCKVSWPAKLCCGVEVAKMLPAGSKYNDPVEENGVPGVASPLKSCPTSEFEKVELGDGGVPLVGAVGLLELVSEAPFPSAA